MKKVYLFIALCSLISIGSCKKDDVNITDFNGSWIEAENRLDTLVFSSRESFKSDKYFRLNRGKEMKNGQVLPKYGSGVYEYKIKGDSILLYNLISSCYCFKNYSFEAQSGTLIMGDFYQKNATQLEKLKFVKLD